MKYISFNSICSLQIPPHQCFEWVENVLKKKNDSILPPKISMKPRGLDGVFCNVMPSIVMDENEKTWCGVKTVTRYPNRIPSVSGQIMLMDIISGEYLALMDGTWITTMRTGAVAAQSIQLFAKQDFSKIGIVGLGNTARATMLILLSEIENKFLTVKLLKYKKQEIDFINRFSSFHNITFEVVDTPEKLVNDTDVVISGVTYLDENVCPDNCFQPGVLIVPIHTRGFKNCDLFFDKVFADDVNHVRTFQYFNRFKSFAEVSDVLSGKIAGRENNTERIIVYNIGISLHDVYFASKIYKSLSDKGLLDSLPDIEIDIPKVKFWV